MTALIVLCCDACHETFEGKPGESKADLRARARGRGWRKGRTRTIKDICWGHEGEYA